MEVRTCERCDAQDYAESGLIRKQTIEVVENGRMVDIFVGIYCDRCATELRENRTEEPL